MRKEIAIDYTWGRIALYASGHGVHVQSWFLITARRRDMYLGITYMYLIPTILPYVPW